MRSGTRLKSITICLMTVLFSAGYVKAFFQVVSQSITPDFPNQKFNFQITFNEVPNFYTFDRVGRQADSFQYYINTDCALHFNTSLSTDIVVRGGEIHSWGYIPIRNTHISAGDGSWGAITGMVPFVLDNSTITFDASFEIIAPLGRFSYCLQTLEYGTSYDYMDIWSVTPIPEPATLLLLGLGAVMLRKKV